MRTRGSKIVLVAVMATILAYASSGPASTVSAGAMPSGNGTFLISVLADNTWIEKGSIGYDRFIREKGIDLSSMKGFSGPYRIRVTQTGGGAAHIDAVTLGSVVPVAVEGTDDPLALTKLSLRDFDVIDASGRTLELTFPAWAQATRLTLTARVEGIRISKTPFHYPLSNLFDPMNERSDFYVYPLCAGTVADPFFREYWPSGSGHPSGYTIGWVWNDADKLYVRLDFTSDNTMDGVKDYAKVYANTPAGMKEFTVSMGETKWGNPEFTYTDEVPYQHKVYNFTIPLKELGVRGSGLTDRLKLAFAAYGTSSPAEYGPDFGYDPSNERGLAVYSANANIFGLLYSAQGVTVGPEITVSNDPGHQTFPAVSFNPAESRYLAVWPDYRVGGTAIFGQVLDADGNLVGASTQSSVNFQVSGYGGDVDTAPVTASSTARFIVAWEDYRNGGADIYGQLLDGDGNAVGTSIDVNFAVSTEDSSQDHPRVAYDSVNNRAIIVMESGSDITAQIVDADDGSAIGTSKDINITVCDAPDVQSLPSAAFGGSDRYLIVWGDERSGSGLDIYSQVIDTDGNLAGASTSPSENVLVSGADNDQRMPDIAYDPDDEIYFVVWEDFRSSVGSTLEKQLYGQFLDANGSIAARMSTADIFVADTDDEAEWVWANPRASYDPSSRSFLVAYKAQEFNIDIQVVQVPIPDELKKDLDDNGDGGGGGGGGCSTIGKPRGGPAWPGLLGVTLLAMMLMAMRRRELQN